MKNGIIVNGVAYELRRKRTTSADACDECVFKLRKCFAPCGFFSTGKTHVYFVKSKEQ